MVEAGDVGTLKVAELKTELSARGLDTKGKKVLPPLPHAPICQDRLPSLSSLINPSIPLGLGGHVFAVLSRVSERDSVALDPPAHECVGPWLSRLRNLLPPVHTAV